MRTEWPNCRRASKKRDELTSPHGPLHETQAIVLNKISTVASEIMTPRKNKVAR